MAKVSGLYVTVKMRRWAKPFVILCAACRLPLPDFLFIIRISPEPIK